MKKYLFHQISLGRFWRKQNGVISIEFAIGTTMLFAVLYIAADFGIAITKQGRIDRAAQSLASLFRERSVLFPSYSANGIFGKTDEGFNQFDVDELALIGRSLMKEPRLAVKVDGLFLSANKDDPTNVDLASIKTVTYIANGSPESVVFKEQDIKMLAAFSPYSSSSSRFVPVYRITLSMPGDASLFHRLMGGLTNKPIMTEITASNIVVSRCHRDGFCLSNWENEKW